MLSSLEIKNFRTFSHLVIERLGRVNLVVGKNGVGKTTLLEALRLYGSLWPRSTIASVLQERNEVTTLAEGKKLFLLQSLFHGRQADEGNEIVIRQPRDAASHGGFRAVARVVAEREGFFKTAPNMFLGSAAMLALEIKWPGRAFTLYADGAAAYEVASTSPKVPEYWPEPPCLPGVQAGTLTEDSIASWWDPLTLTESESRVLDALNILVPIRGIRFVGGARGRMAKVAVNGIRDPVPLATLGDGAVRIFQIAVALEYAAYHGKRAMQADASLENVFPLLLIDEVEVGIHHTLHAKLWRLIFQVARILDVQVFATTHSWDCIQAFQQAAAQDEQSDGLLIRLESGRGKSRAFVFSEEELAVVTREQIEVR